MVSASGGGGAAKTFAVLSHKGPGASAHRGHDKVERGDAFHV